MIVTEPSAGGGVVTIPPQTLIEALPASVLPPLIPELRNDGPLIDTSWSAPIEVNAFLRVPIKSFSTLGPRMCIPTSSPPETKLLALSSITWRPAVLRTAMICCPKAAPSAVFSLFYRPRSELNSAPRCSLLVELSTGGRLVANHSLPAS